MMELSEAIEIVKSYKDRFEYVSFKTIADEHGYKDDCEKSAEAFAVVLKELDRLQKENKCNIDQIKYLEQREKYLERRRTTIIQSFLSSTIQKRNIKKKIEEIKATTETCYGRIKYQEGKIAGLEELLKGEYKNEG